LKDRTAKAALWMLVDVGGSQGLSFAIYAILTRILNPAEYGVFVLALAITAIANIVLFQGFGDALIQRENVDQDDLDTAFWTNLAMGVSIAAALYLSSAWLEARFGAPGLGNVVASLAVLCVLRALVSVHSALCRRDLKMSLLLLSRFWAGAYGRLSCVRSFRPVSFW
jgi:O-antigen/teichoic acid export membrane protein